MGDATDSKKEYWETEDLNRQSLDELISEAEKLITHSKVISINYDSHCKRKIEVNSPNSKNCTKGRSDKKQSVRKSFNKLLSDYQEHPEIVETILKKFLSDHERIMKNKDYLEYLNMHALPLERIFDDGMHERGCFKWDELKGMYSFLKTYLDKAKHSQSPKEIKQFIDDFQIDPLNMAGSICGHQAVIPFRFWEKVNETQREKLIKIYSDAKHNYVPNSESDTFSFATPESIYDELIKRGMKTEKSLETLHSLTKNHNWNKLYSLIIQKDISNEELTDILSLVEKRYLNRHLRRWTDYPNFEAIISYNYSQEKIQRNSIREVEECLNFNPNGYVALKKLGEGGSGKVFLAKKIIGGKETNVELALKEFKLDHLHPKIEDDREARGLKEIIINQFQELAYINHPNIIRMYMPEDYGESFIVPMDYMNGGSLESHLDEFNFSKSKRYDYDKLSSVVDSMVSGMSILHHKGYVLRDFKLGNVLVRTELEEIKEVKIADLETLTDDKYKIDNSKLAPVSDKYAAPEVIRGEKATQASDAYALGAAIYYLLSGEKPSDDTNFINTINKIQEKEEYDASLDEKIKQLAERPVKDPIYGEAIYGMNGPKEGYSDLYEGLVLTVKDLLKFNPEERPKVNTLARHPFLRRF